MATIADYPVLSFHDGIRRDKSFAENFKTELLDARNVSLSERGRVKSRRGSQQVGNTLTGTIENSFCFVKVDAGGQPDVRFLVNNAAATGVVSLLIGTRLTVAVATTDVTITVNDSAGFAASGVIEIDGDLISYTSVAAGVFSGVTGITSAHSVGAPVHQWSTLTQSGTAISAYRGVTYAVLNNICFFTGGNANIKQYDGANVTDVSSEPAIILLTNYRDRLYGTGDGGTNGDPRRVFFSARGDGTTWTTASDFFDVEDQRGDYITEMKVLNDTLGIFKTNSIFTYDEIELKQRIPSVGAYNRKVVQEIDEKIYTFCPQGIFVTNLSEAKQIGDPVRDYWKNFIPKYDTTIGRVCTNTFAWTNDESYFLYIGDITTPYVINDVVLEYNTRTNSWSTHSGGYTDFSHVNKTPSFKFGDLDNFTRSNGYFGGDANGKFWRLYENRFLTTTSTIIGSPLYKDLISDTGSPISVEIETPLYDLTHPDLFKRFKYLRVYTESGQWNIEYRVEDENGVSSYKHLGHTAVTNKVLPFPKEAQGWRCGFRISGVNTNGESSFNGFVFQKTEVSQRS